MNTLSSIGMITENPDAMANFIFFVFVILLGLIIGAISFFIHIGDLISESEKLEKIRGLNTTFSAITGAILCLAGFSEIGVFIPREFLILPGGALLTMTFIQVWRSYFHEEKQGPPRLTTKDDSE